MIKSCTLFGELDRIGTLRSITAFNSSQRMLFPLLLALIARKA